ncbi:hypothetical protein JW949_00440 [Candidatus Woesearchaeota archaeon]|nr:hypothetical protein [Candidatus Woesearchaeota archaeon]
MDEKAISLEDNLEKEKIDDSVSEEQDNKSDEYMSPYTKLVIEGDLTVEEIEKRIEKEIDYNPQEINKYKKEAADLTANERTRKLKIKDKRAEMDSLYDKMTKDKIEYEEKPGMVQQGTKRLIDIIKKAFSPKKVVKNIDISPKNKLELCMEYGMELREEVKENLYKGKQNLDILKKKRSNIKESNFRYEKLIKDYDNTINRIDSRIENYKSDLENIDKGTIQRVSPKKRIKLETILKSSLRKKRKMEIEKKRFSSSYNRTYEMYKVINDVVKNFDVQINICEDNSYALDDYLYMGEMCKDLIIETTSVTEKNGEIMAHIGKFRSIMNNILYKLFEGITEQTKNYEENLSSLNGEMYTDEQMRDFNQATSEIEQSFYNGGKEAKNKAELRIAEGGLHGDDLE